MNALQRSAFDQRGRNCNVALARIAVNFLLINSKCWFAPIFRNPVQLQVTSLHVKSWEIVQATSFYFTATANARWLRFESPFFAGSGSTCPTFARHTILTGQNNSFYTLNFLRDYVK